MRRLVLFLLGASLALLATPSRAERIHIEVSADGSGDFTTVQQAIDDVPDGYSDWSVIHIRPGHYFEELQIPASKRKLILVGDGRDVTVLEYDESFLDRLGRWVARAAIRAAAIRAEPSRTRSARTAATTTASSASTSTAAPR